MGLPARRNSLRYEGYDYASAGGVFVTIVTHNRQEIFGTMDVDSVVLSSAGEALSNRWTQIHERSPAVDVDASIIMPDHIHGILWHGVAEAEIATSTGDIVRWLKACVLADFTKGVKESGWQPYDGRLWQRGYYDHIIRGDRDLQTIREYIGANPATWMQNHTDEST